MHVIGTLTVLLGNGKGAFRPASASPFAAGEHPADLAVACDVNGDGRLDLVTAYYSGQLADRSRDAVAALLGDGRGNFHPAPGSPFHSGAAPVAIVCADLDGDGFDDGATANLGGNSVTLLPGGRQHMGTPRDIAVGGQPEFVAAGSLLGGKQVDLVTADSRDDRVTVLSFRRRR